MIPITMILAFYSIIERIRTVPYQKADEYVFYLLQKE